ncbi:putative disease resistance RPP13-like protein 1 [Morella rubra]|uniref:Putative disease resistance RPP13-like protein 1 n=1 Tax=Morella rubra TaxID=262757 RepID=A0A6A1W3Z5_9ROSI|nr:putative disease resistance RPP13-like protein 1 [Morella rubra]
MVATEALGRKLDAEFESTAIQVRNRTYASISLYKLRGKIGEVLEKLKSLAEQKDVVGLREGVEGGRPSERLPTTSLVEESGILVEMMRRSKWFKELLSEDKEMAMRAFSTHHLKKLLKRIAGHYLQNMLLTKRQNSSSSQIKLQISFIAFKAMFAYCAIFPKDYAFTKDQLVLLWMAEGFLQEVGNKTMEEIAKFVHGQFSFRLKVDQSHEGLSKTRYLSYMRTRFDTFEKFEPLSEAKKLCTFLPFEFGAGSIQLVSNIRELRLLRCNEVLLKELPVGMERLKAEGFDSVESLFKGLMNSNSCLRVLEINRAPEVQLEVRGVQFLFSADVIADFLNCPRPESPCFPAVPLNDEQRTSEQDLWTLMTGKTSAVVGSIIKQSEFSEFWRILHLIWTPNVDGRTHSTECPFTRAQCMLLLGQQTRIDFPLYMFEVIMDEAWEIKEYSLPYGVFLTQFLISRGLPRIHSSSGRRRHHGLRHQRQRHLWRREHLQCLLHGWPSYLRTSTAVSTMKATLQPVERHAVIEAAEGAPDRLRWGVHCDNAAQQVGRGSYGGRQRAAGRN